MSDQDDLWVPCKTIYSTLIIKTIRLSKKMDLHDYLNGTLYQPCVGWLRKKSKCKIFLISFKSKPLSNLCAAELPWLKQMPDRMCGSVPCMLHHLDINKRLQWNINHLTCMALTHPLLQLIEQCALHCPNESESIQERFPTSSSQVTFL